jgi:hypothetical protein
MDYVRSCYPATMRVCADPVTDYPVLWYFAPAGAPLFPGEHSFGSGNWDYDKILRPYQIGEQSTSPPGWYNGENPGRYIGKCFVGTAEQFLNGLTAADLAAPLGPLPPCCQPPVPPIAPAGGVAVAGIAGFGGVTTWVTTPCFGTFVPPQLGVKFSSFVTAGAWAFVAPFTIRWNGADWRTGINVGPFAVSFRLSCQAGPTFQIVGIHLPPNQADFPPTNVTSIGPGFTLVFTGVPVEYLGVPGTMTVTITT